MMESRIAWSSWLTIVLLHFCQQWSSVDAGILVNAVFSEYSFPSVDYFHFDETEWPYFDEYLNGRVAVMRSLDLDSLFAELHDFEKGTFDAFDGNSQDGNNATLAPRGSARLFDDDFTFREWERAPKFLVVDFEEAASFEDAMLNTSIAAEKIQADFVILIPSSRTTWKQRFSFWWSHRFPGCRSDSIPSVGNSTHQIFFIGVDRRTGVEIMDLLEQDARYFGDYSSNEFYFGIDDVNVIKGSDLCLRVTIYMLWILTFSRFIANDARRNNRNNRDGGQRYSPAYDYTGDDLGMGEIQSAGAAQDCPVCLETMQPGETVRVLPCRHMLHHDCITGWFQHGKLTCPLCNMDLEPHLEEHRNASIEIIHGSNSRNHWWVRLFRRRIRNLEVEDTLIGQTSSGGEGGMGDLELVEESAGVVV